MLELVLELLPRAAFGRTDRRHFLVDENLDTVGLAFGFVAAANNKTALIRSVVL